MKPYTMYGALFLGACAGLTQQEFVQDTQNKEKAAELSVKRDISPDCDTLGQLYDFTRQQSPTIADLANIMPVFGLKVQDATDIDKVFNLNYATIDRLECKDNAQELMSERATYCDNKYKNNTNYRKYCNNYFKNVIFEQGKSYAETNTDKLKQDIKQRIRQIYSVPEKFEYLLQEFTDVELIKAGNITLGTYDGDCAYSDAFDGPVASNIRELWVPITLCDNTANKVTRLDAAELLTDYCLYNTLLPDQNDESVCICFAHETYKKVDYKNLIYIFEKGKLPQSKTTEFNKIFTQCKQKQERNRVKKEQNRYGEADTATDKTNEILMEAIENAAWAHDTITNIRKDAQQSNKNK